MIENYLLYEFYMNIHNEQDFLEAAFYTIFDNGLVYEDALNEWKEQSNRSESKLFDRKYNNVVLDKAIVKLNNTIFQIQDILDNRE